MSINLHEFKVRCSAISKVLSNSKDNPQLTEKQTETLAKARKKLDDGGTLTSTQRLELIALEEKEANSSKIILSDTCIEYLMVEYAWLIEGMIPVGKEALDLVAIKKGNMAESAALDLLIRVDKLPYVTHKERLYNDYLSGEIDFFLGDKIDEHTISVVQVGDIKNAFDYPTFLKKINNGLDNGHQQQVQGYIDITGARNGFVAYTLVNCPPEVIEDMKWKLARKMNALTIESPEYLEEWKKWERSMIFDQIPIQKRVYKIEIEPFSDFERQRLYDRVKQCRDWLADFHEKYKKLNS